MSRQAPTRKALLYLECAKSPWCFHRGLAHHVCEHQSSGGHLLQDSCPPWYLPSFEAKEQLHPYNIHKLELETAYTIARVHCHTHTHISGGRSYYVIFEVDFSNCKFTSIPAQKLQVVGSGRRRRCWSQGLNTPLQNTTPAALSQCNTQLVLRTDAIYSTILEVKWLKYNNLEGTTIASDSQKWMKSCELAGPESYNWAFIFPLWVRII